MAIPLIFSGHMRPIIGASYMNMTNSKAFVDLSFFRSFSFIKWLNYEIWLLILAISYWNCSYFSTCQLFFWRIDIWTMKIVTFLPFWRMCHATSSSSMNRLCKMTMVGPCLFLILFYLLRLALIWLLHATGVTQGFMMAWPTDLQLLTDS